MRLVESGLAGAEMCPTLNDYDKSWERIKIAETGGYVLHGQRVYATPEFGAERKMMTLLSCLGEKVTKKKKCGWKKDYC